MHDGTFTVWKVGQNSIKGVFKQVNILWLGKSNCQTETIHSYIYLWGFTCKVKENKPTKSIYVCMYVYVAIMATQNCQKMQLANLLQHNIMSYRGTYLRLLKRMHTSFITSYWSWLSSYVLGARNHRQLIASYNRLVILIPAEKS